MPWIRWIEEEDAGEPLRHLYETSPRPLCNIVKIHSLLPESLAAMMHLYKHVMHGKLPLTMIERETIAVTVSVTNRCHY